MDVFFFSLKNILSLVMNSYYKNVDLPSTTLHQCWAKSHEQCQRSGWVGTFAGQGGGQPELIPARFSYQPESSRFIFFEPAIYIVCKNKKVKKQHFHLLLSLSPLFPLFPPLRVFPPLLFLSLSLSLSDFCLPLCRRFLSPSPTTISVSLSVNFHFTLSISVFSHNSILRTSSLLVPPSSLITARSIAAHRSLLQGECTAIVSKNCVCWHQL